MVVGVLVVGVLCLLGGADPSQAKISNPQGPARVGLRKRTTVELRRLTRWRLQRTSLYTSRIICVIRCVSRAHQEGVEVLWNVGTEICVVIIKRCLRGEPGPS